MIRKILIPAIFLVLVSVENSFAERMTYEEYQSGALNFCDTRTDLWNAPSTIVDAEWWESSSTEWNTNTNIVPVIRNFPRLDANDVNDWMMSIIAAERSPIMRNYLRQAYSRDYIGNFPGYKTVEVANIAYHARMNSLFDCAVVESRIVIIHGLMKSNALRWRTEILERIETELKKLNAQYVQCLPDESEEDATLSDQTILDKVNERVVNTSTLQYCHYRKYLTYLDSNLEYDITESMKKEQWIGGTEWTPIPVDTDTMALELRSREAQITNEISRADRALPRAILSLHEMQRTYAAHILLTIVYNDYVTFRDNLRSYMSPTSQLFEKAFNAMTPR